MKKIVLLVTLGLLTGQSAYAEETTSVPAAQVSSSEMGLPELSDSINEGGTAQETMTSAPDPQKVKVSSEANFSLGGMTWQKVKEDNSEANIGVAYQSQGRVVFNWQYYDISQKKLGYNERKYNIQLDNLQSTSCGPIFDTCLWDK